MVSDGLQQYFDKKRKKKQVASKLQSLQGQIDPAFLSSFERFRCQVLEIVDENPESCDVVQQEVQVLETKLERVKNKKKVKQFNIITDNV